MEYRIAKLEDLLEIICLKNQVKERIVEENLPIWLDGYPKDDLLLDDLEHHYGRVVVDEGKIVGYSCFHPAYVEYPEGTFLKENLYSFGRVMVSNECLGRHYGSFLIQKMIEEAKKLSALGLGILADACNTRAIRLYQKYGFQREGSAEFTYGHLDMYTLYF